MAQPESLLQRRLFEELNDYEDSRIKFIFAIPNGRYRNVATAAALKREGVKRGPLDICLPIKTERAPGAYVEMKYGHNKCTPEQKEFIAFVESQGYVTTVCYEWEDALHFILDYLGVKPKWKHKWKTLTAQNPNLSSTCRYGA